MRVLCIRGAKPGDLCQSISSRVVNNGEEVIEGEKYIASQSVMYDDCYSIHGKPSYCHYLKSRFIPISDISETEMERNYNFKTEPV